MHPKALRADALHLLAEGHSQAEAARILGVPRSTLRYWLVPRETPSSTAHLCRLCDPAAVLPLHTYLYVLGLYLGDGCLSTGPHGQAVLRIACSGAWPGLLAECRSALSSLSPRKTFAVPAPGCFSVQNTWLHWRCLLPQHGPGHKHDRRIVLQPWQRDLANADPRPLLRGLFHSDGCRILNTVTVGGRQYRYPRYFFTNKSDDIRGICTDALDQLGIRWRQNNAMNINVARRADVAALDAFVGPKH